MKLAFLPNYFKKVGIACCITSFAIILAASFVIVTQATTALTDEGGLMSGYEVNHSDMGNLLTMSYYWIIQVCGILFLLSMAFYMLAKEKVDDEYMDAIRWESLKLAFLISIAITIVCVIVNIKLPAKTLLFIQFTSYLITFKVKKSKA